MFGGDKKFCSKQKKCQKRPSLQVVINQPLKKANTIFIYLFFMFYFSATKSYKTMFQVSYLQFTHKIIQNAPGCHMKWKQGPSLLIPFLL